MAKKLLLADDSITIQKVVGITFAQEDFDITYVDNGVDAISKATEIKPDIVLADIVMPQKTGYDVCEAIKQSADLKHIPVLLLAGTFETFDVNRGKLVGADDYIIKPFESQALIDKVNTLLGKTGGAPQAAPEVQAAPPPQPPAAPPTPPAAEAAPPPPPAPEVDTSFNISEVEESSEANFMEAPAVEAGTLNMAADPPAFDADSIVAEPPAAPEVTMDVGIDLPEPVSDSVPIDTSMIDMGDLGGATDKETTEVVPNTAEGGVELSSAAEMMMDIPSVEPPQPEAVEELPTPAAPEMDQFGLGGFDDVASEAAPAAPESLEASLTAEPTPAPPETGNGLAELDLPPLPDDTLSGTEPIADSVGTDDLPPVPSADTLPQAAPTIDEAEIKRLVEAKAHEILEKVAWDIFPELAERIIREEIKRLTSDEGS